MSEFDEEEKKENLVEKLNDSFLDFVESAFGESGADFVKETQDKVHDLSSESIKNFMKFSDDVLEQLNLHENEQVMKTRDSIEDMLKQLGLLKEDEEEFF
jgi:predicted urease superfamily metal-dependent hydrolase